MSLELERRKKLDQTLCESSLWPERLAQLRHHSGKVKSSANEYCHLSGWLHSSP